MTKKEFIAKLESFSDDQEIIIMDHRMNIHFASSEGTSEGIYSTFEFGQQKLMRRNDSGDFDEDNIYTAVAIFITNEVDYEANGDRINY